MPRGENGQTVDRADHDLLGLLAGGEPPAFATSEDHRITFWNRGAERVFGREAREVMGEPCHEVVEGRDIFGNRFCYVNCPLVATARAGESVGPCEIEVSARGQARRAIALTTLRVPGRERGHFSLVHVVHPLVEPERVARSTRRRPGEGRSGDVGGPAAAARPAGPAAGNGAGPPLTAREREILGWVALGKQNKEVACELNISLATVRNHVHNILEKLGVHSKLEAVSLAFRHGWVERGGDPEPRGAEPYPRLGG